MPDRICGEDMIDIVMPVRNTGAVFSLALTHLHAYGLPTGLVSSVTICDNASTDPGLATVLDWAARQPGHMVLRHEANLGVWASINRGLATTRSRYVLILMADLLIGPQTLAALYRVMVTHGLAFVSPDNGTIGLPMLPRNYAPLASTVSVVPDYTGTCWLMDWHRIREHVGWHDPRFYVCHGDVDLIERLAIAARERNDGTWLSYAVRGLPACHLDRQTRREVSAAADSEMTVRDGQRFHDKWHATHPEIAARHPVPTFEFEQQYKRATSTGWAGGKL
jgi:glycosyltransferase involved in cell wall biosynthesis